MDDSLVINEIFFSIQGESSFAGRPCAFVRLTYCNLRCSWCDTEYAFYEGARITLDEVIRKVEQFPTGLVEITGGEPLLQENVHLLIRKLLDRQKTVLIETGGQIDIRPVDPRAVLIYDIKCPDSGMSEKNRWENLAHLRPQDEIKFVLASRADYKWACETIRLRNLEGRHRLFFSPVWERLPPGTLAAWILEDGAPVRLQLQLHKILWGPKTRGV